MTPGAFWVIVARPRAASSTVAAVVASPSPTSSASARVDQFVVGQSQSTTMVRKSGSLAPCRRAPDSRSSRR